MGIFLIGLGILFLLNTMGVVNRFDWGLLYHLGRFCNFSRLKPDIETYPVWWLTNILFPGSDSPFSSVVI